MDRKINSMFNKDDPEELLKVMQFEISTRSNEIVSSKIDDGVELMQSNIDVILSKLELIEDQKLATALTRSIGINMAGMMKAIVTLKNENSLLREESFNRAMSNQNPDLN